MILVMEMSKNGNTLALQPEGVDAFGMVRKP